MNESNIKNFILYHPQDQTKIFRKLSLDEKKKLIEQLDNQIVAAFFEHLDTAEIVQLMNVLDKKIIIPIINNMDSDEVSRVFRDSKLNSSNDILNSLNHEHANMIRELLMYKEDTAGALMEKKFLFLKSKRTIKEAKQILLEQATDIGNISYMYVLDISQKLIGIISLKELVLANDDSLVTDIMTKKIISVNINDDKQKAAKIVKDYDFYSLPVIDNDNILKGIITADDVMDILHEDAKDNLESVSGVQITEKKTTVKGQILLRAPWLIILLLFSIFNSNVYLAFDNVLQIAVVSALMPMIASMSGNVGTQTLGATIYKLSNMNIKVNTFGEIFKYVLSEMRLYFVISFLIDFILAVIFIIIFGFNQIVIVLVLTLCLTFLSSSFFGATVPIILNKLNIDSSVASGPLISTINDLFSIVIYLTVATLILL